MIHSRHSVFGILSRLRPIGLGISAALTISLGSATADEDVPVPEPRPAQAGEAAARETADPKLAPQEVPKPEPRPEQPGDDGEKRPAPADVDADRTPPPRPATMPAEEAACRVRLKELGVAFEERPQLADPSGCSVPWPIAVTTLSPDAKLAPEAVMNCATAERTATFLRDHIAPKAKSILGSEVSSIRQDSAYVCRPRNGTHKLSEHAFGNALDIGAFILKDGRTVAVGGATKRPEGEFMLAVRLAACGPFTTVLGPGSDADHATHFHFDLAKRRPGSTFCQ